VSARTRDLPPLVDYAVVPLVNLVVALIVSGLVVLSIGESPVAAVKSILYGALGRGEGIGYTLYYATNFIFTGLAVAVAYHAGLFNIGVDGQAVLGGLGVALVCLYFDGAPWWLALPFVLVAALAFGAAWAYVPAWLQARRDSHIVITTIMANYIAATLMNYLLVNVLNEPGNMAPETRTFQEATRLPFLSHFLSPLGIDLGASPVNPTFLLALAAAAFVWVLIWRTRFGYEVRATGTNPTAAVYGGIDPARIGIIAMLISGALGGLVAVNEVMSVQARLILDMSSGAGFVGIAVALMGRSHPVGIVLAAILFGVLYQGGAELAFDSPNISRDLIVVIQGLVILFAGALEHMFRPALTQLFASKPQVE
jgi:simple sugar transport system permease protein